MMFETIGRASALGFFICAGLLPAQQATTLQQQVVRHHAAWCFDLYGRVHSLATTLQKRVDALVKQPDAATLKAARTAWLEARKVYGQTEALRFHDGPIEPLEPLLNAWPVDEAYIDYVEGRPDCGIVNDPQRFPSLSGAILQLANERGGEANICVGWHAIEFMLWGQDLSPAGAGERPFSDYQPGVGKNAERRGQYLLAVTGLLVDHLGQLKNAWAPGAKYRQKFERDVDGSIRRMLTGITVLSAFELGGERLVVAYETRDQEQEHSCFSDNTWQDFVSNQQGVAAIVLGCKVKDRQGPGLIELIRSYKPDLAASLQERLESTRSALAKMPKPFDQAMLGEDNAPGRKAMLRAIEALEQQTEVLLIVGKQLGHDLPVEPGD